MEVLELVAWFFAAPAFFLWVALGWWLLARDYRLKAKVK